MIGIVLIGRNEGQRLRASLAAVARPGLSPVYVDSGSIDGSAELARSMGMEVIELDPAVPFTAARARNAGFARLSARRPAPAWVQFIDGDCELCEGWLECARGVLEARPDAAIACGRVRERFPQASVYNRICDIEWRQPLGDIEHCGGNFMMRAEVFRRLGGFDPDVIAAEDTEFCTRVRLAGWRILSVDADMVRHDAAMLRFRQWFIRALRAGHALTEGAARHGRSPARLFVKARRRIFVQGLLVPVLVAATAWPSGGWSLLLLGAYPLGFLKAFRGRRARGESRSDALVYAGHCVAARIPQALGQILYVLNRLLGRRSRIIEHKRPVPASASAVRAAAAMKG
jgi:GT2 family glycosyltransferase